MMNQLIKTYRIPKNGVSDKSFSVQLGVFLNIAMICSVFFISPYMSDPVTGLAIGVLIGGVLQLALQVPFLIKKGLYFWQRVKIGHPGLKRIGVLMLPTVFGAAVYQINILVGTLLASLLLEGSVSYLYYADRLVQFPLMLLTPRLMELLVL